MWISTRSPALFAGAKCDCGKLRASLHPQHAAWIMVVHER